MDWTSPIEYTLILYGNRKEFKISYTNYYQDDTEKEVSEYIHLTSVPSNIGKGGVYYFICPSTQVRSKNLYLTYWNPYFGCRQYFKGKLYYESQTHSKKFYYINRGFDLDSQIEDYINVKYRKWSYKGKPTIHQKRYDHLCSKQELYGSHSMASFRRSCLKFLL